MFGGYKFVRRKRIKTIKRIKRKGKVLIVEEEIKE
jgi:hypothetical protein